MAVEFAGYTCVVRKVFYSTPAGADKRIALMLLDAETLERVAIATVNLPERGLLPGHVFIKNWSENKGILEALIAAGIIEDTGVTCPTGRVQANVCKYLGD